MGGNATEAVRLSTSRYPAPRQVGTRLLRACLTLLSKLWVHTTSLNINLHDLRCWKYSGHRILIGTMPKFVLEMSSEDPLTAEQPLRARIPCFVCWNPKLGARKILPWDIQRHNSCWQDGVDNFKIFRDHNTASQKFKTRALTTPPDPSQSPLVSCLCFK